MIDIVEKLKILEESYENKTITKEEYEKQKEKLEKQLNKMPKKEERVKSKGSDKLLLYAIIFIILLFIVFFSVRFISLKERPKTIDELHELNLKGKLKPSQGYLYNSYSFVFVNGLWYTQVQAVDEDIIFDLPLHYGPKELEDISIEGWLNGTKFNSADKIYITFNPLEDGNMLGFFSLAISEFDQSMIKAFGKEPIAACDRKQTEPCQVRPIINCDNTDVPVFYIQKALETSVVYDENCIIISGPGKEVVRATNRVLYDFYKIMER